MPPANGSEVAANISDGTTSCVNCLLSQAHKEIAALSAGVLLAAISAPPPPIDQPMTATRAVSIFPFSGLPARDCSALRLTSASKRAAARASGWSVVLFVPIVMVTIPCDARNGPQAAMDDCAERNPGTTATPVKGGVASLGY